MRTNLSCSCIVALLGLLPGTANGATAAAPRAAAAAPASLLDAEIAAELSCDEHQRPRPCRKATGAVGFQCAARSPLAAVLHWLEGRASPRHGDDRVVVTVAREVEQVAPAATADGVGRTAPVQAEQRIVRVRKGGELRACRP